MTLCLGELANPCLISRTILKSMGKGEGLFYTVVEAIFAFMFLVLRAFICPFWMEIILVAENCPLEWKFGIAFVYCISMMWNIKILLIFLNRYKEIIGDLPYALKVFEDYCVKIDKQETAFYYFYFLIISHAFIYPAVYYGMYRQTLFQSF